MAAFTKVTASEPTKCERWGCDRTIPTGGDHHIDTRTNRSYCLSADCHGVLSADFQALGNAVGRRLGVDVVRGLAKQATRGEDIARIIGEQVDLGTLPVFTPEVKAPTARQVADVLTGLSADQLAAVLAQVAQAQGLEGAAGSQPAGSRVVTSKSAPKGDK